MPAIATGGVDASCHGVSVSRKPSGTADTVCGAACSMISRPNGKKSGFGSSPTLAPLAINVIASRVAVAESRQVFGASTGSFARAASNSGADADGVAGPVGSVSASGAFPGMQPSSLQTSHFACARTSTVDAPARSAGTCNVTGRRTARE